MKGYNINISVGGGNRRSAFGANAMYRSKGTLDSSMYRNNDGPNAFGQNNLKKIASIGMVFNVAQKYNEAVGAFTNNRLRQREVDTVMTFAKYGIGIATLGPVGVAYALGDMAYRGVMYSIDVQKKNREAQYFARLSGNSANSGSRYRGDFV